MAIALHFMFYNLQITPAKKGGSDHAWTLDEISALVSSRSPKREGRTRRNLRNEKGPNFRSFLNVIRSLQSSFVP